MIAQAPQRWPSYSHGTRKFVLRRFPFLVVYRELATVIQVLAVAHAHGRTATKSTWEQEPTRSSNQPARLQPFQEPLEQSFQVDTNPINTWFYGENFAAFLQHGRLKGCRVAAIVCQG